MLITPLRDHDVLSEKAKLFVAPISPSLNLADIAAQVANQVAVGPGGAGFVLSLLVPGFLSPVCCLQFLSQFPAEFLVPSAKFPVPTLLPPVPCPSFLFQFPAPSSRPKSPVPTSLSQVPCLQFAASSSALQSPSSVRADTSQELDIHLLALISDLKGLHGWRMKWLFFVLRLRSALFRIFSKAELGHQHCRVA